MSSLRYSGPSRFYKELVELPVPTSAKFIDRDVTSDSDISVIRVSYSIRDHERNLKRSITKTLTLSTSDAAIDSPVISSTISQDSSEILAFLPAPSGKRCAYLKEASDANGSKKRFVEVWSGTQLEASLEVTKQHGQFHTDDYFKSFSFSPSETALVYTAEANPETTEKQADDPYPKFRFTPHFGEQLYTKKRPYALCIPLAISISGQFVYCVPVLFGQATFATDTRLYATGYRQTGDGKLLGIKGCFNRLTSIWELILPSEGTEAAETTTCKVVEIDFPGRASRSPRILFDKDRIPATLLWLSNPVGGAHASTVSLHIRDLKGTAGDRVLVDVVYDPTPQDFPGLYTDRSGASRPTLLSIDVENGAVIDLTPVPDDQALYSWTLLATDGSRSVLCSRSTPTTGPETVLLTLAQDAWPGSVRILDKPAVSLELQEALAHLDTAVIPIPNQYPVETIVIRTKEEVREGT
ncbi:hypothetical protein JVU11DRAFT_11604 [Chiua virens]|nr:hypothetical protein JVU11DRAFT_11604 [Chiua virens]